MITSGQILVLYVVWFVLAFGLAAYMLKKAS